MKHTVSMKENHLFRRLYNKGQSAVARVHSAFAPYREVQRDLLRLLDKLGVYRR